jgi:hypothetical protein
MAQHILYTRQLERLQRASKTIPAEPQIFKSLGESMTPATSSAPKAKNTENTLPASNVAVMPSVANWI